MEKNNGYLAHMSNLYSKRSYKSKCDYIKYNFSKIIASVNPKKDSVLDVGPGFGELVEVLQKKKINKIEILDNDVHVIKHITNKFGISNAHYSENISKDKSLLKSYKAIFMLQVLEHIPRDIFKKFVKTLYDHLDKDGVLVAMVPNGANPFSLIERYGDLQHEQLFTKSSLIELDTYCNLDNCSITVLPYNIPPSNLINFVRIFFQKIFHFLLYLCLLVNGGNIQRIMTPNIYVVLKKNS